MSTQYYHREISGHIASLENAGYVMNSHRLAVETVRAGDDHIRLQELLDLAKIWHAQFCVQPADQRKAA